MSEEAKKNIAGVLTPRPQSDDRKPLPLALPSQSPSPSPVATVPPKKVIIKSADMIPDMQKEAVDIAVAAFEKYNVEKDVAEQIKKEFDKRHGPTWHCIVGRNFEKSFLELMVTGGENGEYDMLPDIPCSYVTHETNHFVYFYLDQKAVLLFKSG